MKAHVQDMHLTPFSSIISLDYGRGGNHVYVQKQLLIIGRASSPIYNVYLSCSEINDTKLIISIVYCFVTAMNMMDGW